MPGTCPGHRWITLLSCPWHWVNKVVKAIAVCKNLNLIGGSKMKGNDRDKSAKKQRGKEERLRPGLTHIFKKKGCIAASSEKSQSNMSGLL
jgi:hypothetical protein